MYVVLCVKKVFLVKFDIYVSDGFIVLMLGMYQLISFSRSHGAWAYYASISTKIDENTGVDVPLYSIDYAVLSIHG